MYRSVCNIAWQKKTRGATSSYATNTDKEGTPMLQQRGTLFLSPAKSEVDPRGPLDIDPIHISGARAGGDARRQHGIQANEILFG